MKTSPASAERRFTLVEPRVGIAIIAILAGRLLPALATATPRTKQVNALNAARQLMLAWQPDADDNADDVLLGYSDKTTAFDASPPPDAWGDIQPRWNKHAVGGFTDRHAASMITGELQDTRHWANPAAHPDRTVLPLEPR